MLSLLLISGCSVTTSPESYFGDYSYSSFYIEPSQTALLVDSSEVFSLYKLTYSLSGETASKLEPIWILAGDIGTMVQDGTFTATKEGIGYVIASYESNTRSVTVTVTSEPSKTSPAIPTGLSVSNVTHSIARVTWNSVSNASEYTLRYSTKPQIYLFYYTISTKQPSALLTDLSSNTMYYIQVQAYNDYGYSRFCSAESFVTSK